ncbi:hypothetical protein CTI14_59495, partial [Methylobacterium radiotolerans]
DLELKRGVMTPRVFVFDTDNALITITGSASFKDETLDLDIDPDSKGFRIFSLRSKLFGDDEVKINWRRGDLELKRGVMTPRVFVFDTDNALITITGSASFK